VVLQIGTLDDPSAPDVSPNFEQRVVSGPHGSGGPAPRPNGGVDGPHGSGGPAPPGPTAAAVALTVRAAPPPGPAQLCTCPTQLRKACGKNWAAPPPGPTAASVTPTVRAAPPPQAPRQRRWPSRFGRLHPPTPRHCVHVPHNFEKRVVKF